VGTRRARVVGVRANSTQLATAELRRTLQVWAGRPDAWRPLVHHDQSKRVYALLHRDDEVEIYLVCWMPDHDTGSTTTTTAPAAITVLEGRSPKSAWLSAAP
jgi:hypothetical protein